MILSKTPIISTRNHLLPKWGAYSQHSIQQGALEAVIETPAGPLRVYSVHLSHLSPETRMPQIERLLHVHEQAPWEGGAWCGGHPDPAAGWTEGDLPPMPARAVVMGDFNCQPDSEEYTRLIGPYSERYGRIANGAGLVDAWVAVGHDERVGATSASGKRIDYVLISAELGGRVRSARVLTEARGSDHYPVIADIEL